MYYVWHKIHTPSMYLHSYMVHQQKFRSGAYNVIVATSIGEEGLDIMEVDLVISFDANISPLRMIQRMGRTGRKYTSFPTHKRSEERDADVNTQQCLTMIKN